jgi:hypothetical protein
MKAILAGGALVVCLTACGDNSRTCGPGTDDKDGDNICEPIEGSGDLICGDGTVLDQLTNECVPSDTVCGNGTVLINGKCQDPNAGLTIDLEEGFEPNGFEQDATLAGTIALKADDQGFVLHGCIKPVDNNSPDLDVFEVTVTEATLLEITVDGVGGLAGGFLAIGDAPAVATWFRLGISVISDTSKRQLFLPVAGTYQIVMADSRTLLPITQNGEGFPAAGNPDGTSCYFATVTKRSFPNPVTLDLVNGNTGTIADKLVFFTAGFPTGITSLIAVIDPEDLDDDGIPDVDSRAASSLILVNNGQLRQIQDSGRGNPADSPISEMAFGGITGTDAPLVILDYVWNIAPFPADFAIDIEAALTSQALSTTGGVVNATSNGQAFIDDGVAHFEAVNLFHFDVTEANEIDGIDIAFSIPVQGSLLDQETGFASPFTGVITEDQFDNPTINTFTSYRGLLRNTTPGRYYFFVIAPRNPAATAFTVTSTITQQIPNAVTLDTATATQSVNFFNSNALTYNAGTAEPWQLFNATSNSTGGITVQLFDPTATVPQTPGFAFGRLDTLTTTFNNNAPGTEQPDSTPLVAATFAEGGGPAVPRILKNPVSLTPPAVTNFLVKVNPVTPTGTPNFVLDFESRFYEDFNGATLVAPASELDGGQILQVGDEERYYFETAPGNLVTITATTKNSTALDTAIVFLDTAEGERSVVDAVAGTGAESITFAQNPSGFTAFKIRGSGGVTTGDFDVAVDVVAGPYALATSNTTFSNACIGGAAIPLVGGGDEGLSAPLTVPSGFDLFGTAVTSVVVSSNGFLSVDPSLASATFDNLELPDGTGDVNIAPYWDDMEGVVVCAKTVNGRMTVQWTGDNVDQVVQFQAILDAADDSITFVYGPNHQASGAPHGVDTGATIGVQNAAGDDATPIGFGQPVLSPGSALKLTPN